MKEKLLKINTLGVFTVGTDDQVLTASSARSAQLWKLFKYIITNRANPIPTEKLMDALWPEGDCDNPIRALYNLVYRLRSELKKPFEDGPEFFTFQHNCYIWKGDAPYVLDVEEFEKHCRAAADADDRKLAISHYRAAFDLYRGDYLTESQAESWVIPAANYYKRMYSTVVGNLCALYKAQGDHASVVTVCERAIELDPFEEDMHALLIESLIEMGQLSQALAHYDYISSILYRELGVRPSERLQELNRRIHSQKEDVQTDIGVIMSGLSEMEDAGGAYFCDLEFFRKIYQIERRALERSSQSVFLASITLTGPNHRTPPVTVLNDAMVLLRRIVMFGLRRGDVVTQYSKSQLLLLLPSSNFENCEKVLARLRQKFTAAYRGEPLSFQTNLDAVAATDMSR